MWSFWEYQSAAGKLPVSEWYEGLSEIWRKLRDKAYRDGYTEAQLSIEVPFQIRAIRKARGWTQAQLAERSGIPQARISHIEQPGRDMLSLRTLYRLAAAFDVGLLVQFVSFSELVRREADFDPETFRVPSFAEDHVERVVQTTDIWFSALRTATTPQKMYRIGTSSFSRQQWRLATHPWLARL